MKLATWNVNSLNVRLPRLLDWLAADAPDVVCLQETKLEDAKFPRDELRPRATQRTSPARRRTTASRSRARRARRADDVVHGMPGFEDAQKRVIAATVAGMRIICVYVPNGQAVDSDKYRLQARLVPRGRALLRRRARAPSRSSRSPATSTSRPKTATCTIRAVGGPGAVLGARARGVPRVARAGLQDSFRLFEQPPKTFSWWDYRQLAFPKNHGLRIDHILLSPALARRCTSCRIDRNARKGEKPSDHAPVIAEFAA